MLPGTDECLADLLIPYWQGGQDAAIDFTVVNPLQAALVQKAAMEGSAAVEKAHQDKIQKYWERCREEGIAFIPVAVDTLGGFHREGLKTVTKLGRQLARAAGREEGEVVRHLRQRLGVLLVRDNVAMLNSRSPTFTPAEVDGDNDVT